MPGGIVVTRSLAHEIRFRCSAADIYERVKFIETLPEIAGTKLTTIEFDVEPFGDGFRFVSPEYTRVCSDVELLDAAHAVVREFLLSETEDGLLLHAASMRIGGDVIVIVGDKGAGKTTLSLKALAAGHEVFGDEHVYLGPEYAITRPRTLRVKEKSIPLLPELANIITASDFFVNWDGERIFALAPSAKSGTWRLAPYRIRHFVHLVPNHGGLSSLDPVDKTKLYPVLMEQSFLPSKKQGKALALLWNSLQEAATWEMKVGNLNEALTLLAALPNRKASLANSLNQTSEHLP